MFTLEIGGVAIAMTDADESEARTLFQSDEFKEDLKEFTSEGRPVWNGKAPFTIRPATEAEIDLFDEALEDEEFDEDDVEALDEETGAVEAEGEEEEEEDEDGAEAEVMFLVPIDQFEEE